MKRALVLVALVLLAERPVRSEELRPQDLVERLSRARRSAHDAQLELDIDTEEETLAPLRKDAKRLAGATVRSGAETIDADPGIARELDEVNRTRGTSAKRARLAKLEKRLAALEDEARRAAAIVAKPDPAPVNAGHTNELQPATKPPAGEKASREVLAKVLDQPRFKKRTENIETWGFSDKLESLQQRIENWWIRLMQPTPALPRPAWLTALIGFIAGILPKTAAGWFLLVGGLVLVIVLFLWFRSRNDRRNEEPGPNLLGEGLDGGPSGRAVVREETYSEDHWRREARLLARQGDHRGAIRALYTGVLLYLQRAGRLRFDKGKTNWEHVRELRRNDRALAQRLEPLTRTFDVAWYGQKPVEPAAFDVFLAEADGFTAAASGDAVAAPAAAPPPPGAAT